MFNAEFFVAISFIIFVGLILILRLPRRILNVLDERSLNIQKELEQARSLREEAQIILAKEKKKLEEADVKIVNLLKNAEEHTKIFKANAEKSLSEDIERKKKQSELKIKQVESDAIKEVKLKATELSLEIAKAYIKQNFDSKMSSKIFEESIKDLKKNL
jgi:F-type H+-transporting ATPase subunit b|tara:strand:- start:1859 stop:2338 length:480 start_codon:yes stop_codon:yes gene_type:complete